MHCMYWHGILEKLECDVTTTAMAKALLRLNFLASFLHRTWQVRFLKSEGRIEGCYVHVMCKMLLFWAITGKTCAYFLCFDIKLKKPRSVFDLVTVLISKQSFFQHRVLPGQQGKSYLHGMALPDFYIVSSLIYKNSNQTRVTHNGASFRSNDAQLDQRGMYSQLFFIRRHGHCIYCLPKTKYLEYQAYHPPPIKLWNFSNPNIYPHSVHRPLKKKLKSQKWPQNHSSWPKNIHKIFKFPKYSFFNFPHPKKYSLKFKNLNPKNDPSLRMCESIRVHPPPGTGPVYMSTKYQG